MKPPSGTSDTKINQQGEGTKPVAKELHNQQGEGTKPIAKELHVADARSLTTALQLKECVQTLMHQIVFFVYSISDTWFHC